MAHRDLDRRSVLVFGVGGAALHALSGCAVLRGGAVHRQLESSRAVKEGALLRIPLEELRAVEAGEVLAVEPGDGLPAFLIARGTDGGFPYAVVTSACPHRGCTVDRRGDGWACPCHDSRFAADGSVQKGPAQGPLGLPRVALERPADATEVTHLLVDLSALSPRA
jgi:cytochrome b6-f complex iron-sulfur subunit